MDLPSVRQNKILLYDFYGGLLTEHQRHIYTMHYQEDCSLTEIGEALNITPQAVSDTLRRCVRRLEQYEQQLNMVEKFTQTNTCTQEVITLIDTLETLGATLPDLLQITNKIRKLLNKMNL